MIIKIGPYTHGDPSKCLTCGITKRDQTQQLCQLCAVMAQSIARQPGLVQAHEEWQAIGDKLHEIFGDPFRSCAVEIEPFGHEHEETLTTEQLAEKTLHDVQQMSPKQREELYRTLEKEFPSGDAITRTIDAAYLDAQAEHSAEEQAHLDGRTKFWAAPWEDRAFTEDDKELLRLLRVKL